ncbi:MAG: hypothetical protein ABGW76_10545 [Mesonia sp.]|uniref:hypothetical protein n=1 Tax=Mesonia sp. TaxID=1960830 RepID=UPI0032426D09
MNGKLKSILLHDNEHLVSHKRNNKELENWITHLLFIEKEIRYLKKLCKKNHIEKDYYSFKLELERKELENNKLVSTLKKYNNNLSMWNECEDIACDRLFILEHELYRAKYDRFTATYRNKKELLFNLIT